MTNVYVVDKGAIVMPVMGLSESAVIDYNFQCNHSVIVHFLLTSNRNVNYYNGLYNGLVR